MANYGRELRMEANVRKKRKVEKTTEFVKKKKYKRRQKQCLKQQADREKKKAKEWKKGDRVILSMQDLVFKKKASKETSRLIYQFIFH